MGLARRVDGVWRAVCGELLAAQLPDCQLRQGRRRVAGCRLLLHVQRPRPADRHAAVGLGVSGLWLGSLPVGVLDFCLVGGVDLHWAASAYQ